MNQKSINKTNPNSRKELAMKGAAIWRKLEARATTGAYNNRIEAMEALARDLRNSPGAIDDKLLVASTGPGRVAIFRPLLPDGMGSLAPEIRDGMGAMIGDVRPLIDIIFEPGAKYAPLEGLTSEQVKSVFALCEGTPTHWVGDGGQDTP